MSDFQLDRYDLRILRELQNDGSQSNQDLADIVGLTPAPCSRRVKILRENGVIRDWVVRLNERTINLDLTAILHIRMDQHTQERFDNFERIVSKYDEVLECYLITGHDADYQLKVVVPNMDCYHDFLLGKITRIAGVSGVTSSFIMRKALDRTAFPLDMMA
ncbi:MAG: AsnC family transcriptional regulator [Cellvibrionales bacterium TMED49]|nr:MAG: AsnC family transcriptional regulator [Cellvibrionales bacterium TMED49]|tara:strand:- start:93 stop:575 length:483 start_codon:yes stop_codon:yes gene_type:complete